MAYVVLANKVRLAEKDVPSTPTEYKRLGKNDKIAFLERKTEAQKGLIRCWMEAFLALDNEECDKVVALTKERDELKESNARLQKKLDEMSEYLKANCEKMAVVLKQLELNDLALTGLMQQIHQAQPGPDVFMDALDQVDPDD